MRPEERNVLEGQLVAQLTDVEREIGKLESQRETLRSLLSKVRRENLSLRDVTRKNSFDRILIENRILDIIKTARREVPTRRLYWAAREINPQIRSTTFRSYLHRMKVKGIIASSGHGYWVAPERARLEPPGPVDSADIPQ